jgi:hypothetical protein
MIGSRDASSRWHVVLPSFTDRGGRADQWHRREVDLDPAPGGRPADQLEQGPPQEIGLVMVQFPDHEDPSDARWQPARGDHGHQLDQVLIVGAPRRRFRTRCSRAGSWAINVRTDSGRHP